MVPALVGVVPLTSERAGRRRRALRRIVVVGPPGWFRRTTVEQLTMQGYEVQSTGSLSDAIELIAGGSVDALVLHASAFSSAALSRLGGLGSGRRSVSLIVSVSVASMSGPTRSLRAPRELPVMEAHDHPSWRLSMYWLPFSGLAEFCSSLACSVLN
jgi:hypothetical protein